MMYTQVEQLGLTGLDDGLFPNQHYFTVSPADDPLRLDKGEGLLQAVGLLFRQKISLF